MTGETLLIVDDEATNLAVLDGALSHDYRLRAAKSGERAVEAATSDPAPDLILLDVKMPGMDGYRVLELLQQDPKARDIPVIFVTALDAADDEERGFEMGAVDYITKPIRPAILRARVRTHLALKAASDALHNENDYLEAEVARRLAENHVIEDVSIRALAYLAETRDPETGNHINRTQAYVECLARALRDEPRYQDTITDQFIQLVTKSAPLHDIGKVGIPDHILLKPGKLTDAEWAVMKTHAALGAWAIDRAEQDAEHAVEFLSLAKEIAHWHHERWDGSGYPDGLSGEQIPLSARLMAIADVFDAVISPRVYKSAVSFEQAREIISEGSGTHFDPLLADVFLANYPAFVEIARRHDDEPVAAAVPQQLSAAPGAGA